MTRCYRYTARLPAPVHDPEDLEGRLKRDVLRLFALVSEALAGATDALLRGEATLGSQIVDADELFDERIRELTDRIWERVDDGTAKHELRRLVGLLLMLPELERSADLAEHIAQRAANHLGPMMSPVSRGVVQRMSEVGLDIWRHVALAYENDDAVSSSLREDDEELDVLLQRLHAEVSTSSMTPPVATQVTLLGRFYERLGDHGVNLAKRIEQLAPRD